MGRVAKENRIFSIICALSNIEISHRDGHEDFHDFHHRIKLNLNEAIKLFPGYRVENILSKALEDTGGIALQMHQLIVENKFNEDNHRRKTFDAITESVYKLKRQQEQDRTSDNFAEGIIQTLLKSPTTTPFSDKKYFVDNPAGYKHFYEPLFPLVEEVYIQLSEVSTMLLNCLVPSFSDVIYYGVDRHKRKKNIYDENCQS